MESVYVEIKPTPGNREWFCSGNEKRAIRNRYVQAQQIFSLIYHEFKEYYTFRKAIFR